MYKLPNGEYASYLWGSAYISVSPWAYPNKSKFSTFISSYYQRIVSWESKGEFRAEVCLLHEYVHLCQDLTTGLGHHDYFARREEIYKSIGLLKGLEEYRITSRDWKEESFGNQIFAPREKGSDKKHQKLKDLITLEIGQTKNQLHNSEFSIESLLESEAVSLIYLYLSQTKRTEEQTEIAIDESYLWQINNMSSEYNSLIYLVIKNLMHWADDDALTEHHYTLSTAILSVLVDLSLAYPPNTILESAGLPEIDFHPTIKFLRLLKVVFNLNEVDQEAFWNNLKNHNNVEIENLLLSRIDFPYPKSKDIYNGWCTFLEEELKKDDHGVLWERLLTAKKRVGNDGMAAKTMNIDNIDSIPIIYSNNQGNCVFHYSNSLFEKKDRDRLMADVVNDLILKEIENYFLLAKSFKCPAAKIGICEHKQQICFEGIENDSEFPDLSKCKVRRDFNSLNISGF